MTRRPHAGDPEPLERYPLELDVASTPRSVPVVRRYCVDACCRLGWDASADTVALLVSELATNAVVHAGGSRVRVRVRDRGRRLRVEVSDDGVTLPVPRRADRDAENGRGLELVDELALASGCKLAVHGKTAWFEIGL